MDKDELVCRWQFPSVDQIHDDHDLAFVGADLEPATLLAAYTASYFPMPLEGEIGWFSPLERGVLFLHDFKASRSLRRSDKKFRVTFNTSFVEIMKCCADPSRDGAWISDEFVVAYKKLFDLGAAFSVEVWNSETSQLAGGLYGVKLGDFYAGESMFHHETDASKVALLHLVEKLQSSTNATFVDTQWSTPHLKTLGVKTISRGKYVELLQPLLHG